MMEKHPASRGTASPGRNINGKLFVLMVDNPQGPDTGLYGVLELDDDPKTRGGCEMQKIIL
jgi:hypothetical protein